MHNHHDQTAVAVVAMSAVFPGSDNLPAFWENLTKQKNSVCDMPEDAFHGASDWLFRPASFPDKAYSKKACLIKDFRFNPDGFDLNPELLSGLDPLHQWALSAARDCIQPISLRSYDKKRIGVILAAIALPTRYSSRLSGSLLFNGMFDKPESFGDSHTMTFSNAESVCSRVVGTPAALVARAFGFGAGSMTLDAACASSLYAVKLACDELLSFRADVMFAGGVSGADTLYTQIGFSQLKALSASGRCAPFDRSADGLVVGEGAGVLVLKRLEDALRDGDTVYGVIRGIGLSNDMRGNLLAPEPAGQLRAMRAAYQQAGWLPEDVDYIECHGAGTPVGDAAEIESLVKLWEDRPWKKGQCHIGSVKSMIGHLLTGAGAAGLIKTLLAMHHKTFPPSLNFTSPPANSPLADSAFKVQSEPEPWPERGPDVCRRAAVSAFGFGGINAHVLVEAYLPETKIEKQDDSIPSAITSTERMTLPKTAIPIAIVGMATHIGELTSLDAFQYAVFDGHHTLTPLPAERWKIRSDALAVLGSDIPAGGFIKNLTINMGEFRIPPAEIPDILPQQLLMLKTAARAMQDAGLPLRTPRENMGAIIGIGFDYESTNFNLRWSLSQQSREWAQRTGRQLDENRLSAWIEENEARCCPPLTATRTLGALGGIVASRIAREFQFGGPSFVVSSEETSGLRAMEIGARFLQSGLTDCMLVGAVDLFCDERNLLTVYDRLSLSKKGKIKPFDAQADGSLPGEGAVAFVLKRLDDAIVSGDRIYATIQGFGRAGAGGIAPERPSADTYAASLKRALDSAGVSPLEIGLAETHGSGIPDQDDCEADALKTIFTSFVNESNIGKAKHDCRSTVALGALKPITGHTGVVSGLASAAKAALSLYHRLIPVLSGFQSPRRNEWLQPPLYPPGKTSYWARDCFDPPRTSCVGALTADGNCMHAVLREAPQRPADIREELPDAPQRPLGPLAAGPASVLFLFDGDSKQALSRHLDRLETLIKETAIKDYKHKAVERHAHAWNRLQWP